MKKDESDDKRHKDLRQQAEELLKKTRARDSKSQSMHEEDMRAIVHELQVHQIELEMQNEELQRARNEAEVMSNRYIGLFDFAPIGYFTFNEDNGSILLVNLSGAKMLGVERSSLIGKRFAQFLTNESKRVFNDFCKNTLKTDKKQSCEVQLIKGDATSLYIQIEGIATENTVTSGKEIRASVIDITDRRQTDEDHLKMHKLESLGILAGGIAHDFNNLLAGILGNISLSLMHLNPEDKAYKWLEHAENASLRAQELTYQLLTFSKGGTPSKNNISITTLLKDTVAFALSGSNIKINLSIPDGIWTVNADKGQINQVISNLAINAMQVMPDGGIIKVGCENAVIEEGNPFSLMQGNYVKITISDTGHGIPDEQLGHIFDPFFTTKPRGRGLGLSICYSILNRHDGYIGVESSPGAGTTFYFFLPACFEKTEEDNLKIGEKPLSGMGKVLLMDDEDIIIQVASDMLYALGYELEYARNGEEAIEKYKNAKEIGKPFDAVIMDLTIPGGIGGKDAIINLKKIDPAVRAIVSSGYSNDPIVAEYKDYGFMGTLSKPFGMQELSEILRKVLNA